MEEQADVFTTTARWIVLPTLLVVVVTTTTLLSLLVSSWKILFGLFLGGWTFVVGLLLSIIIWGYVRIPPPPRCWEPPHKRSRNCGRRRRRLDQQGDATDDDENFDYIIIGSGIGGLTCGACLTQFGYRVCVLEAHEVAGGSTHEYTIEGYGKYWFPSGLHYVIPHCQQVLQVSVGSLRPTVLFERLGINEDESSFGGSDGGGYYERIRLTRCYQPQQQQQEDDGPTTTTSNNSSRSNVQDDVWIKNESQFRQELHQRYPLLKKQLERYETISTRLLTYSPIWMALHVLNWKFREPLMKLLLKQIWWKYAGRTAKDVITELFEDAPASEQEHVYQLVSYLNALWVDTGCPPHRVSFFLSVAVALGFPHEGGAYPVGGPQEISKTLVERIEDSDGSGKVWTRSPVQKILIEKGKAVGIQLATKHVGSGGGGGEDGAIIRAKHGVVSACGWRNTCRLIQQQQQQQQRKEEKKDIKKEGNGDDGGDGSSLQLFPKLSQLHVPQGDGFVMANIGIRGTAHELNLQCYNLWPLPGGNGQSIFEGIQRYLDNPLGVPVQEIPMMITFPSIKDRGYDVNSQYQTAQILVLAKTEWFLEEDPSSQEEQAEEGDEKKDDDDDEKRQDICTPPPTTPNDRLPTWKPPQRSDKYKTLKEKWKDRLMEAFLMYYPQLEGKIELFDISTPLTIEHYLPTWSGSAIGLDVCAGQHSRFTNLETMKLLDMKTPVPGLWMTGQDTLLIGVPMAQAAGLMTALRIGGPIASFKFILKSIWLLLYSWRQQQPRATREEPDSVDVSKKKDN